MMPGIDVQKRHGNVGGAKRLFRQSHQTNRILATGEHQAGPVKFRGDFTDDVNRFRFEVLQMVEMVTVQGVKVDWLNG